MSRYFRSRRKAENQSGFSVIELIITSSVMIIVVMGMTDFLYAMQKNEHLTQAKTQNQEEVRFAMLELARDIRASNPIGTYSSVSSYQTSIDVALGATTGTQTFVRWEISGNRLLRENITGLNGTVTGSRTVLTNIANTTLNTTFLTYYNSANTELETGGSLPVTPGDIVNCTVRIHIGISADPSPGPIFTERLDAELRNRLPGGVGC